MKIPRFRALVLTAGFGVRLRPLTFVLPKALLPVCGQPLVSYTLDQLDAVECNGAALNLHHLADQIPRRLGDSYRDLRLTYSLEEEVLGTLGALYPLRDFLAEFEIFVLINGDSLCKWPLGSMIRRHLRTQADATLLLHRRPPKTILGGPVGVDSTGAIVQLRDAEPVGKVVKRHLFAGAHILSSHLLQRVENRPADIVGELYIPLLREGGRIQSVVTSRRWHDLGTPDRYLEASLDWSRNRSTLSALGSRNLITSSAEIDSSAAVHRSVVEEEAKLGPDVVVEDSLLMPKALVPRSSTIRRSIIGSEVVLPAGANLDRRLVTRVQSGYYPGTEDSVMGDLVYTPLNSS